MKRTYKILLTLGLLINISATIHAYMVGFTNFMPVPMAVRFQYRGLDEPFYEKVLAPYREKNSSYTFYHTGYSKNPEASRKRHFCVKRIQVQPYKRHFGKWVETGTWVEINPHFVEPKYSSQMIEAAGNLASAVIESTADLVKISGYASLSLAAIVASKLVRKFPMKKLSMSIMSVLRYSLCKDLHFHLIPNVNDEGVLSDIPLVTLNTH